MAVKAWVYLLCYVSVSRLSSLQFACLPIFCFFKENLELNLWGEDTKSFSLSWGDS